MIWSNFMDILLKRLLTAICKLNSEVKASLKYYMSFEMIEMLSIKITIEPVNEPDEVTFKIEKN